MSLFADLTLPATPTSQTWRQESATATFRGDAVTQRVARNSPRWACQMVFANVTGAQRRYLISFIARCEGSRRSFFVPVASQSESSVFPELLTAPEDFTDAAWTKSNGTVQSDHNAGRLINSAGSAAKVTQEFTGLANTQRYALQAFGRAGTHDCGTGAGTLIDNDDLATNTANNGRTVIHTITPTAGQSVFCKIFTNVSGSPGSYCFVYWASFSRCGAINGASQTGVTLALSNLPAATTVARAGEFFEVNGELKMLTADLITAAAETDAIAYFAPSLRASPATTDAVIFCQPRARMILNTNTAAWSDVPHLDGSGRSTLTIDCIEALD